MRLRLSPRDTAFYDMFTALAENVRDGVRLLGESLGDDAERPAYAARLKEVEHAGDEHTHNILKRVNSTFITPFDREDIYRLASNFDDVLDHVEEAVDLMVLYQLGELPGEIGGLADVLDRCAVLTAEAMPRLRSFRDLEEYWIEINRLENVGDQTYRRLLARIFSGEYDPLTVHKLNDVVRSLENAVDSFEHVANTVEQIALKES